MDQIFCNDYIPYSTGHDCRKRLKSEEEPDYTGKSKHFGYFSGLFSFCFWGFFFCFGFFPLFFLFFCCTCALSIHSGIRIRQFHREWRITATCREQCGLPPQAFGLVNLCKPTFKMKQNYPMLFRPILNYFVIERTCQTVWTVKWKSRNTKVVFCFFPKVLFI